MFAPVGLLTDIMALGTHPPRRLVAEWLVAGLTAVAYVLTIKRRNFCRCDPHDRELGLEGIKGVIRQHADAPLDRVRDALLAAAHGHGPQLDDQTMLLIRASA